MKTKNKIELNSIASFQKERKVVFLVAIFFSLFSFSWADENGANIFKDRDGDGLSDQEELAIGTDPDNPDSDSDGYSDGVEIKGGFDPLIPAPNDRTTSLESTEPEVLSNQADNSSQEDQANQTTDNQENQEETNLTEEFLSKISSQAKNTSEEGTSQVDSLSEDEIQSLVEETLNDFDLAEEVELIPEEELKFLPKPKGSDEEIKKETKKQIEEYLAAVSFIAATNSPILIQEESELKTKMVSFFNQMALNIQSGDQEELAKLKEIGWEVFEEIKEIEAPYVLKDHHQMGLSLFKYFLEQEEDAVLKQDDPLALALLLGKIQGALSEIDNLETSFRSILDEYEIESFLIPAGGGELLSDEEN